MGQSGLGEPSKLRAHHTSTARNWNEEFQEGLDRVFAQEDFLNGYSMIANVVQDFQESSSRFLQIIISELGVKSSERTLKTGTRSDEKFTFYEVQNIMFKVAHGGQGSASWLELGNEFRHSMQVFRCHQPGICIPLMCLYDYKGFRVLVYAKLPAFENLVLGWDHRQGMYVSDSAHLSEHLGAVSKLLNLSRHQIGTGDNQFFTYLNAGAYANTAGNVSSNQSNFGKRYYLTNLKDLMPVDLSLGGTHGVDETSNNVHCETPLKLRPEFLRRNPKALNADIPLPPPGARAPLRYVHDGSNDNFLELKRAIRVLHRMVPTNLIDRLMSLLRELDDDEDERLDPPLLVEEERSWSTAATSEALAFSR